MHRTLKSLPLLILMLCLASPAAADGRGQRSHPRGEPAMGQAAHADDLGHDLQLALRNATAEIDGVDALLDSADNAAVRREIRKKLRALSMALEDARGFGKALRVIAVEQGAPPPKEVVKIVEVDVHEEPPPPRACSEAQFSEILRAVNAESFADGRLAVLSSAASTNLFEVSQVRRLMASFSFPAERVEVGKLLHPRTVDLQNWYQVYQEFTFDSYKKELREAVGM